MQEPLYKSRPGGFDLASASMSEAQRVNDFIHASHGLSNSFLVSTPDGRVVVNTGMGFEAPVHKRNFDAVDPSPTRYILLTQAHVDHVGGVDLFREEGNRGRGPRGKLGVPGRGCASAAGPGSLGASSPSPGPSGLRRGAPQGSRRAPRRSSRCPGRRGPSTSPIPSSSAGAASS